MTTKLPSPLPWKNFARKIWPPSPPSSPTALRAVAAGADIILISHEYEAAIAAYNAILRALNTGVIPMERIDASVRRILRLKLAHADVAK